MFITFVPNFLFKFSSQKYINKFSSQLSFTIFIHNSCSQSFFTTFIQKFCSKLFSCEEQLKRWRCHSVCSSFCPSLFVKTPTQPQLDLTKLGLTRKWLYTTTDHPPGTQCRQYLSCYWSDFDKTLKVASWEHLEQIVDICQGNICPGDICPYQEYLSCYWTDVDQALKVGSWNHL